ncbi:diguanylate cyclase domain-containing protein [Marinobacterium aestuariivivens]|uniref:Diguanylate cyclase domain-containing protein n=1 Tax=Marinobacterium aestuariivivens TaxID=1698799 RepID=A0ABW2A1E5_9GAMM
MLFLVPLSILLLWLILSTLAYRRRMAVAADALRLANRRLSMATSVAGVGVWEWLPSQDRLIWNPVMYRLHGLAPGTGPSLQSWKALVIPEDGGRLDSMVAKPGCGGCEIEIRIVRPDDGEVRSLKTTCQWLEGATGWRLIGTQVDITEEQGAKRRLFRDVYRDALTGLQNKRALDDHLAQQLTRDNRRQEQQALFFIDLDGFKAVNDTWGHDIGDRLLQGAANRMRLVLRHDDQVYRLGGDEFVVSIRLHGEPPDVLERISTKLIESLAEPFDFDGRWCRISASLGIARAPLDGDTPEALLKAADTAMYEAKKKGKNRFCYYNARFNQASKKALAEN